MLLIRGPVQVEGTIDTDVETRKGKGRKTVFYLRLDRINTTPVTGRLFVQIFRDIELKYGDTIRFKGRVSPPFEDDEGGPSTYSDYLHRRGVYHIASVNKRSKVEVIRQDRRSVLGKIYGLRHAFLKRIDSDFPRAEAGFLKAILLGDRSGIPDHVEQLFLRTGTVHIIAISGLHIVLIAGIVIALMRLILLPRKAQLVSSMVILMLYGVLAGGRDSVYRAVLMCVIFLGGKLIERESDSLNSLAAAALIILTFKPYDIFEIGFQLSFLCVLMILIFVPLIKRLLIKFKGRVAIYIADSFAVSFGVWMGVWPIIAYYFRIITPVSIIANLIIVPCSLLIVLLGIGYLLISLIPFTAYLSDCFIICIKASIALIVLAVHYFEQIPAGYFFISDINHYFVVIYYLLLTVFILIINNYKYAS
jgi:competence protein ComEC